MPEFAINWTLFSLKNCPVYRDTPVPVYVLGYVHQMHCIESVFRWAILRQQRCTQQICLEEPAVFFRVCGLVNELMWKQKKKTKKTLRAFASPDETDQARAIMGGYSCWTQSQPMNFSRCSCYVTPHIIEFYHIRLVITFAIVFQCWTCAGGTARGSTNVLRWDNNLRTCPPPCPKRGPRTTHVPYGCSNSPRESRRAGTRAERICVAHVLHLVPIRPRTRNRTAEQRGVLQRPGRQQNGGAVRGVPELHDPSVPTRPHEAAHVLYVPCASVGRRNRNLPCVEFSRSLEPHQLRGSPGSRALPTAKCCVSSQSTRWCLVGLKFSHAYGFCAHF